MFINLPKGADGKQEVSINVDEIASYENHTVTSYSYPRVDHHHPEERREARLSDQEGGLREEAQTCF